jgi:hypothetical protein
MRSKQLQLDQYDSDKIASHYLDYYDPLFKPFLEKKITLLEVGVRKGGSVLLWKDYFPLAQIVGIDISLPKEFAPIERITLFEGDQADTKFLSNVASQTAPEGFDIIIDDASHYGELTKTTFWHLFDNHLKPNGLYVIEDWGTGYWEDWPDGKHLDLQKYLKKGIQPNWFWMYWTRLAMKLHFYTPLKSPMRNHSSGMVGFIKQLVDEQGAGDVTRGKVSGAPKRTSKFQQMIVTPSIVFIKKSSI